MLCGCDGFLKVHKYLANQIICKLSSILKPDIFLQYDFRLTLFLDCKIFLLDFILQREENCHLEEMQFKM